MPDSWRMNGLTPTDGVHGWMDGGRDTFRHGRNTPSMGPGQPPEVTFCSQPVARVGTQHKVSWQATPREQIPLFGGRQAFWRMEQDDGKAALASGRRAGRIGRRALGRATA